MQGVFCWPLCRDISVLSPVYFAAQAHRSKVLRLLHVVFLGFVGKTTVHNHGESCTYVTYATWMATTWRILRHAKKVVFTTLHGSDAKVCGIACLTFNYESEVFTSG